MAWLTRDPALSWLRVEADRAEYTVGQTVKLDVRTLGPDYRPLSGADVTVRVETAGSMQNAATPSPAASLSKSGRTDDEGRLRVELVAPAEGGYRVHAEAHTDGRSATAEEVFLVRAPHKELEQPEARDDLLRALARASGGTFHTISEGPFTPRVGPAREVRVLEGATELWSSGGVLACAAIALSLYWLLRRRWGYR